MGRSSRDICGGKSCHTVLAAGECTKSRMLVSWPTTGNGFYSVGLFVACCTAWLLKGRVSGTQRDTDRQTGCNRDRCIFKMTRGRIFI